MSTGIDAREWLARFARSPRIADPCRDERLPDIVGPGEPYDDGSILTDTGEILVSGRIALTEAKMRAAAYYGWRSEQFPGRILHFETLEPMHVAVR